MNVSDYNIITSAAALRRKCEPVQTQEEADEIIKLLEDFLKERLPDEGAVSAIQLGVMKEVSIIRTHYRFKDKDKQQYVVDIINPTNITLSENKFLARGEGCSSLPKAMSADGKVIKKYLRKNTLRSRVVAFDTGIGNNRKRVVAVASDVGSVQIQPQLMNSKDEGVKSSLQQLPGAVVAQIEHELDHQHGVLILDRAQTPVRVSAEVKPNAECPCGSGKKYKRCCAVEDEEDTDANADDKPTKPVGSQIQAPASVYDPCPCGKLDELGKPVKYKWCCGRRKEGKVYERPRIIPKSTIKPEASARTSSPGPDRNRVQNSNVGLCGRAGEEAPAAGVSGVDGKGHGPCSQSSVRSADTLQPRHHEHGNSSPDQTHGHDADYHMKYKK